MLPLIVLLRISIPAVEVDAAPSTGSLEGYPSHPGCR